MRKSFIQWLPMLAIFFLLIACGGSKEVKTKSGFKVVFHERGSGKKVEVRDWVFFSYTVSVGDSILDVSSDNQPDARLQIPDQITDADPSYYVLEAFELCRDGDSISLFVPISTIPGPKPEFFKDDDILVYSFRIKKILDQEAYDALMEEEKKEYEAKQQANYDYFLKMKDEMEGYMNTIGSKAFSGRIINHPKGMKIYMITEGEGPVVESGQSIKAHYLGMLSDRQVFDASYQRGETFDFQVGSGQVIEGWDEGFQQLNKGSKAILEIPSSMGYGDQGAGMIPPKSTLYFLVELVDIKS